MVLLYLLVLPFVCVPYTVVFKCLTPRRVYIVANGLLTN